MSTNAHPRRAPLAAAIRDDAIVGAAVASPALSLTVTARAFANDGVDVAPFKAQNMSNNADVTPDRLELGRSPATSTARVRSGTSSGRSR